MSKSKKKNELENKSLSGEPEKEVIELPVETSEPIEVELEVEPEVEPEVKPEIKAPPFLVMPGSKKPEGLTVKERVLPLRDKVLKLYKKMKPGERLTEKQFAKRLKLKNPKDIQAAGIAWHLLFDEKLIPDIQFYKPVSRTNR